MITILLVERKFSYGKRSIFNSEDTMFDFFLSPLYTVFVIALKEDD